MTASYDELKPLENDALFGKLPEELEPDTLAKLSLDEIRERMSARINPDQGSDKALAQAVIAEIVGKLNAYEQLASADVYDDDISKLEELGLAAWQGMHNYPASATPENPDVTTQWRQTAFKYRAERHAKKFAEDPNIEGPLPEFPTASGKAYDKASIKIEQVKNDGTLVITANTRFIIKDDAQRIVDGEPSPKIDVAGTEIFYVEVNKKTGEITWDSVRDK